ncbi:MAG: RsmE family RNA methyltransferase [Verrucomicrobiia bacterium]|jgi:16S rRNA (uracil1498-N3)-methyltransferase
MNIVLFEPDEIGKSLELSDERAKHILNVLRRQEGDTFDAGVIDGKRGKATLQSIGNESIELQFDLRHEEPLLFPIDLIVGLSRPQTNRKILQEATSMGVRSLSFVTTERAEPSYATSKLWTTGEWRRHVIAGVVQAFTTRMPKVSFGIGLEEALEASENAEVKIALDNYEAESALSTIDRSGDSIALALGSERGWTGSERQLLRAHHFRLAHLGSRPLRTETAAVAGIAVLLN